MNVDTLWQDFRHGLRLLRLNAGFTCVALLSLALGIGANTAIFQLLDAVRLRMLPVNNPQELVELRIDSKTGRSGSFINGYSQFTYAQWEALRSRQQVFSDFFSWGPDQFNLASGGEVRNASGLWVSGNAFSSLGVQPILGRVFSSADDYRGCGLPGAVISYSFWQREFGGDPGIIGRKLNLNSHPLEIIGVTPASFYGMVVGRSYDVAVPLCGQAAINPAVINGDSNVLDVPYIWWLSIMGRLKPGVSTSQAAAQLNAIAPALFHDTMPAGWAGTRAQEYLGFRFKMLPAGNGASNLREDYTTPLWILLGIAGLVLLIACANLANLMLARASAREREIAVRLALGAARGRLLRQLLTESLFLSAIGAVFGLGVAGVTSGFLVNYLSTQQQPVVLNLGIDWRMLAFITVLAALTCLLFGLTPALRAVRTPPAVAMNTAGRGLTATRERFGTRRILVVCQVALSLVLLVAALLFVRSLHKLLTLNAGFQRTGILVADADFTRLNIPSAQRLEFKRELLERIRALPGVERAAIAMVVPLGGNFSNNDVFINGEKKEPADLNRVSDRFFSTMGTPLLAGRDFDSRDNLNAPAVAIVNQAFAQKFFPGDR